MEYNEEMRVIAVGDDDQNIYAFRGSDSKYMESLMHEKESVQYELIENYRSKHNLVQFSNTFVPQSYATRSRCGCFVAPMGGS